MLVLCCRRSVLEYRACHTVYTHSTLWLWGIQAMHKWLIEPVSRNMHCILLEEVHWHLCALPLPLPCFPFPFPVSSSPFPLPLPFTTFPFPSLPNFFIFPALSFPSPAPWHALPSLLPSVIKPAAVTTGACTAVLTAIPAHTKRCLPSEIYLEVLAMASAGTGTFPANCTSGAQAHRWLCWQNNAPAGRYFFLWGSDIHWPGCSQARQATSGLRAAHGTVTLMQPFKFRSNTVHALYCFHWVSWLDHTNTNWLVAHVKEYLNQEWRMISFVKQWPVNQEMQLQFLALPRLFG